MLYIVKSFQFTCRYFGTTMCPQAWRTAITSSMMQVDEQRTCTLLILATKHETRSTLLHRPETHTNATLNVKLCIVATHARCQSGVCTYLPHFHVIQFVNAPEISLRHRDVPDGSFLADHSAFTSHHRTGRNSLVKFSFSWSKTPRDVFLSECKLQLDTKVRF